MAEGALIGVVSHAAHGETRVAATPPTVRQLIGLGYGVLVESGAGAAAGFTDEAYAEAGAEIGDTKAAWGADVVFAVRAPEAEEIAMLRDGGTLISLLAPGAQPGSGRGAGRAADHRARDGRGAAHLPGAVDGRAVLDGEHRRLPRGDRGRARVRPLLHRAGDRRRQGAAGQGAGGRRRRRGARGDRRRLVDGRDRARHRPAPRGRRPGQVARRGVPAGRRRAGAVRHRLRHGDHRGLQPPGRGDLLRAGRRRRHHHHHRADPRPPGAEADHRRGRRAR